MVKIRFTFRQWWESSRLAIFKEWRDVTREDTRFFWVSPQSQMVTVADLAHLRHPEGLSPERCAQGLNRCHSKCRLCRVVVPCELAARPEPQGLQGLSWELTSTFFNSRRDLWADLHQFVRTNWSKLIEFAQIEKQEVIHACCQLFVWQQASFGQVESCDIKHIHVTSTMYTSAHTTSI